MRLEGIGREGRVVCFPTVIPRITNLKRIHKVNTFKIYVCVVRDWVLCIIVYEPLPVRLRR